MWGGREGGVDGYGAAWPGVLCKGEGEEVERMKMKRYALYNGVMLEVIYYWPASYLSSFARSSPSWARSAL
jgi:hypothetical protein